MSERLFTETEDHETYCIVVRDAQRPQRIDTFIADSIKDLSRTKVRQLMERDLVSVNGSGDFKASYKVCPKDVITVKVPRYIPLDVEAENIPLDVIYEDDDLIVINKPPGLVVHPAVGNRTGTLVNALAHRCTMLSNVGGEYRPGIVHRLDKDTSGAIIAAKNNRVHRIMAHKFEYRYIKKFYTALVWGVPRNTSGSITKYIGRHRNDRQRYAAYTDETKGKHAETRYEVPEAFGFVSLLRVQIMTGRTHQIRVHLSDAGHPVFGDVMYGGRTQRLGGLLPRYRKQAIHLLDIMKRQALHCAEMEFRHPVSGDATRITAPLPEDMQKAVNYLREHRDFS